MRWVPLTFSPSGCILEHLKHQPISCSVTKVSCSPLLEAKDFAKQCNSTESEGVSKSHRRDGFGGTFRKCLIYPSSLQKDLPTCLIALKTLLNKDCHTSLGNLCWCFSVHTFSRFSCYSCLYYSLWEEGTDYSLLSKSVCGLLSCP